MHLRKHVYFCLKVKMAGNIGTIRHFCVVPAALAKNPEMTHFSSKKLVILTWVCEKSLRALGKKACTHAHARRCTRMHAHARATVDSRPHRKLGRLTESVQVILAGCAMDEGDDSCMITYGAILTDRCLYGDARRWYKKAFECDLSDMYATYYLAYLDQIVESCVVYKRLVLR